MSIFNIYRIDNDLGSVMDSRLAFKTRYYSYIRSMPEAGVLDTIFEDDCARIWPVHMYFKKYSIKALIEAMKDLNIRYFQIRFECDNSGWRTVPLQVNGIDTAAVICYCLECMCNEESIHKLTIAGTNKSKESSVLAELNRCFKEDQGISTSDSQLQRDNFINNISSDKISNFISESPIAYEVRRSPTGNIIYGHAGRDLAKKLYLAKDTEVNNLLHEIALGRRHNASLENTIPSNLQAYHDGPGRTNEDLINSIFTVPRLKISRKVFEETEEINFKEEISSKIGTSEDVLSLLAEEWERLNPSTKASSDNCKDSPPKGGTTNIADSKNSSPPSMSHTLKNIVHKVDAPDDLKALFSDVDRSDDPKEIASNRDILEETMRFNAGNNTAIHALYTFLYKNTKGDYKYRSDIIQGLCIEALKHELNGSSKDSRIFIEKESDNRLRKGYPLFDSPMKIGWSSAYDDSKIELGYASAKIEGSLEEGIKVKVSIEDGEASLKDYLSEEDMIVFNERLDNTVNSLLEMTYGPKFSRLIEAAIVAPSPLDAHSSIACCSEYSIASAIGSGFKKSLLALNLGKKLLSTKVEEHTISERSFYKEESPEEILNSIDEKSIEDQNVEFSSSNMYLHSLVNRLYTLSKDMGSLLLKNPYDYPNLLSNLNARLPLTDYIILCISSNIMKGIMSALLPINTVLMPKLAAHLSVLRLGKSTKPKLNLVGSIYGLSPTGPHVLYEYTRYFQKHLMAINFSSAIDVAPSGQLPFLCIGRENINENEEDDNSDTEASPSHQSSEYRLKAGRPKFFNTLIGGINHVIKFIKKDMPHELASIFNASNKPLFIMSDSQAVISYPFIGGPMNCSAIRIIEDAYANNILSFQQDFYTIFNRRPLTSEENYAQNLLYPNGPGYYKFSPNNIAALDANIWLSSRENINEEEEEDDDVENECTDNASIISELSDECEDTISNFISVINHNRTELRQGNRITIPNNTIRTDLFTSPSTIQDIPLKGFNCESESGESDYSHISENTSLIKIISNTMETSASALKEGHMGLHSINGNIHFPFIEVCPDIITETNINTNALCPTSSRSMSFAAVPAPKVVEYIRKSSSNSSEHALYIGKNFSNRGLSYYSGLPKFSSKKDRKKIFLSSIDSAKSEEEVGSWFDVSRHKECREDNAYADESHSISNTVVPILSESTDTTKGIYFYWELMVPSRKLFSELFSASFLGLLRTKKLLTAIDDLIEAYTSGDSKELMDSSIDKCFFIEKELTNRLKSVRCKSMEKDIKNTLANLRELREKYTSELRESVPKVRSMKRCITSITKGGGYLTEEEQIKLLIKKGKLLGARYVEDGIALLLPPTYIWSESKIYDIGSVTVYIKGMYTNNFGVYFYNEKYLQRLLPSKYIKAGDSAKRTMDHPHVRGGVGCLGNIGGMLNTAVNEGDVLSIVSLCKSYIGSVNVNDAYGKSIRYWPHVPATLHNLVKFGVLQSVGNYPQELVLRSGYMCCPRHITKEMLDAEYKSINSLINDDSYNLSDHFIMTSESLDKFFIGSTNDNMNGVYGSIISKYYLNNTLVISAASIDRVKEQRRLLDTLLSSSDELKYNIPSYKGAPDTPYKIEVPITDEQYKCLKSLQSGSKNKVIYSHDITGVHKFISVPKLLKSMES